MSPVNPICRSGSPTKTRPGRPAGAALVLHATSMRIGPAVIVTAAGRVDDGNAEDWSLLVGKMAAVATVPGPFVIDVGNLILTGTCAYRVLAREARRCRSRGINMCLVSNAPIVARTVAANGLRPVLAVFPTVDVALSRGAAAPFNRGVAVVRR